MEKDDKEFKHVPDAPLEEDLNEADPEDPQDQDDPAEVDYKALLEEETALRIRAEDDRDNYRRIGLAKKGKRAPAASEEDEDDAPITRRDLDSVVERALGRQSAASVLDGISTNPDEKALIQQIYNTRIVHTGTDPASVRRDLLSAKAIANQGSILKREREVAIALKNRPDGGVGRGGGGEAVRRGGDRDFSQAQLEEFKRRNIDPEKVRKNLRKVPHTPITP